MRKRKQRKYTDLQKQEVLSSIWHGVRTVSEAADCFNIPRSTVDTWVKNEDGGDRKTRAALPGSCFPEFPKQTGTLAAEGMWIRCNTKEEEKENKGESDSMKNEQLQLEIEILRTELRKKDRQYLISLIVILVITVLIPFLSGFFNAGFFK